MYDKRPSNLEARVKIVHGFLDWSCEIVPPQDAFPLKIMFSGMTFTLSYILSGYFG